jgi:hypothetical protein
MRVMVSKFLLLFSRRSTFKKYIFLVFLEGEVVCLSDLPPPPTFVRRPLLENKEGKFKR